MKIVLLLSGGLDSSVLLYHLLDCQHEVITLSARYGQRHSKELSSAWRITSKARAEHHHVDFSDFGSLVNSALTTPGIEVPQRDYTPETLKATIVPNRNALLLSAAFGLAFSLDAFAVAYAAHSGDHAIYPDCRPEFIQAFGKAMELAWFPEKRVKLIAPFEHFSKSQIVHLGSTLNVPFELTYSCYVGEEKHCGKCSTCRERQKAFIEAGVVDPTEYEETQ